MLPPDPFSGNSSPDLFFGALPRALHGCSPVASFGATAPDPVLGALPPMPLVAFFFSRKKKKVPKKKFAGCMNFAKNSTFFPKMLKLGAPLLKQVSIS